MNSTKLVFLAHCLLNQLVRAGGSCNIFATQKLLKFLSDYSVCIYQLPCPEYLFAGRRDKKPQDAWEVIVGFKDFVSRLAAEVEEKTKQLIRSQEVLMIAISRSPCCSASTVYRGNDLIEGKGIWVSELEKIFKCTIIEFDYKKIDESICRIKEFLEQRID